ncbi:MAG: glycosyltransferase [Candidatus Delongbacteria bacterium]|nr:glycosyltransferase [Candidatus Delongbacteria bacterium]
MKILFIGLDPIKFDARAMRSCISASQNGCDVNFIGCSSYKDRSEDSRFNIHEIHFINSFPLSMKMIIFWVYTFYLGFKLLVNKNKFDLIVSLDIYPLLPSYLLKIIYRSKFVYDIHEYWRGHTSFKKGSLKYYIWTSYENFFISKTDYNITVGNFLSEKLANDYKVVKPRVLPNIPMSKPELRNDYLREKFKLDSNTFIYIYQGTIYKGESYRKIIDTINKIDNCALVFITHKPDRVEELKQYAKHNNIDNVYFHEGVVSEKLLKITASANCGLTILDNLGDTFYYSVPNKMYEFILAGIPQISSNFPEMIEIVEKNEIGITLNPDMPVYLDSFNRIRNDINFYKKLVSNVKNIQNDFSWERIFVEVYEL